METSLKTGFAQIFSCCPKNLSWPKFGGAAAPPRPPGPYAYVNGLSLQWMHPKKMLFSTQNITCEVAYIWLLSNRLRLNNDSAGSHIKEEGKLNMYTTRVCVWFRCSTEFIRLIGYDRFRRVGFRVLFIGFSMYFPSVLFIQIWMWSFMQIAFGILWNNN